MTFRHTVGSGVLIGLAMVIPGLSAGTVALILGIYRPLLRQIAHFEIRSLIPLALGVALGVVAGVAGVQLGLARFPYVMQALFFGVVLATLLSFVRTTAPRGRELLFVLAGVLVLMIGVPLLGRLGLQAELEIQPLWLGIAGLLSAATMVLPGMSGGTALVLLNVYDDVIRALTEPHLLRVAWFLGGALIGLLLATRGMSAVFDRWRRWTFAVLMGLMAGSLPNLVPARWDVAEVVAVGTGGLITLYILNQSGRWESDSST